MVDSVLVTDPYLRCRMVMGDEELAELVRLWGPLAGDSAAASSPDERRRLGDQLSVREELVLRAVSIRERADLLDEEFAAWLARCDKLIRLAWFVGPRASLALLASDEEELEAALVRVGGRAP